MRARDKRTWNGVDEEGGEERAERLFVRVAVIGRALGWRQPIRIRQRRARRLGRRTLF